MPFCSWCLKDVRPTVADSGLLTRHLLRCPNCGRTSVECRACKNLACWDSYTVSTPFGEVKRIAQHDQFCGEHRHVVRNFHELEAKLRSPAEYRIVYDFRVSDMSKHVTTALLAIGGIAIGGPLALAAGPAIGGALGVAAGGLSGAAASSAGLALIGGGSLAAGGFGMAGGLAVLSVVGGGVGGALGAYVAGQYLSDVKGFEIYKVRDGRKPAIITVNGFLTQRGEAHKAWTAGIDKNYPDHEWYHIEWEAKNLANLGALVGVGVGTEALKQGLIKAAKVATKVAGKVLGAPATIAQLVSLSTNPWHVAMTKAEKTGVLLADILGRCDRRKFILVGHSLGCRVIYSCLQTLATTEKRRVAGVHLFAGAVHNELENWRAAAGALATGAKIRNYHSDADQVLRIMYSCGTFFQSVPIGRHAIQRTAGISNHDCSALSLGHMDYKKRLHEIPFDS
jgi:hypothetical protein